ncbi:hypothetical protein Sjap_019888 [Stephania japonica]|uniref:UBC core domain-containing protein n=1 Tax=Stephania japonica TaxID=461633 RepID=A0AAP0F0C5_9MAGN
MAQAARLGLRLQKELKLLLSDPPHGVSLPAISPDAAASSSSPSLSTIDAQIEGPEGTVYAKGLFGIRIQIPERYPFQPPNVTFTTPIYHPNIDNGGRICLDILNLPPKVWVLVGAWQPSINISTILTSIGLLLSEPNPDDGLMCEAVSMLISYNNAKLILIVNFLTKEEDFSLVTLQSREYKYDRQTFDQKARSMTAKYATGSSSVFCGGSMESDRLDSDTREVVNDRDIISSGKESKVSRKLSLEAVGHSQQRNGDGDQNMAQPCKLSLSHSKNLSIMSSRSSQHVGNHDRQLHQQGNANEVRTDSNDTINKCSDGKESAVPPVSVSMHAENMPSVSTKSLQLQFDDMVDPKADGGCEIKTDTCGVNLSRKKLSLKSVCSPQKNVDEKDGSMHKLSPLQSQIHNNDSINSSSTLKESNCQSKQPQINKMKDGTVNVKHAKLLSVKKKSLKLSGKAKGKDGIDDNDDNKENIPPNYQSVHQDFSMTRSNVLPTPQVVENDGKHRSSEGLNDVGGRKHSMETSGTSWMKNFVQNDNIVQAQKLSLPHDTRPSMATSKNHPMTLEANKHDKQFSADNFASEEGNGMDAAAPIMEAVIVLDSEDSEEEEKRPKRSRVLLAGKRLAGRSSGKP